VRGVFGRNEGELRNRDDHFTLKIISKIENGKILDMVGISRNFAW
jgi:hypothetical protein